MSDAEDHCSPKVRLLEVERHSGNCCGFHLTRSKWDPYPWISNVDTDSAAQMAGMQPGDCLLEVNGEDVLGQRVGEIAEMVRAQPEQVSLLLWNAGVDPHCGPKSLCCGPMPSNMQRLSTCVSSILSSLECPVCLETIPPPACQCINGHLVCVPCHAKSERCPVCRVRLSKGRSLFADQVYNSLIDAFELAKEEDEKTRRTKIKELFRNKKKNPEIKITPSHTNKFLERCVDKSSSAENLSNQYLSPKTFLSDEFNCNMRVKSLSTSEIFCPGSPSVSRSGSRVLSKANFIPRIISSCRRSFECLNKNISNSTSSYQTDDIMFYCPFSADCDQRLKGSSIIDHFKTVHDGPLIQYFKSKISFYLLHTHENTYCILHSTGKYFYLKINAITDEKSDKKNYFRDILIWMWIADDQNIANECQLKINVYSSKFPTKLLLSLTSSIFSLSNTSWKEMLNTKKGVFVSRETLKTLNLTYDNLMLDVEIIHYET